MTDRRRAEYPPAIVRSHPYDTVHAITGRSVRRTATLTDARLALHTHNPEGGTYYVLDHAGELAATLIMADHRTPEERDAATTDEEEEAAALGY